MKKLLFLAALLFSGNVFATQTIFVDGSAGSCTDTAPVNVGNGTCSVSNISAYALSETVTFVSSMSGPSASFQTTGSLSGSLTTVVSGAAATVYDSNGYAMFSVTLTDGGIPYALLDSFSVVTTAGTELKQSNFDLFDLTQVCLNGCDAGGAITATNISGTNTGDQTITLTGDVTGSGTGSFATSVDKIQSTVVSGTTGSGNVVFSASPTFTGTALGSVISLSSTITASNFSGSSSGANTGDITLGTANGLSLVGQALSLALSSTSTTGSLTSADWNTFNGKQASGNYITALTGDVTASGPGSVAGTIANNAVTNAKSAQMATLTLKGNNTGGASDPLDLTVAQVKTMLSLTGTNSGDLTLTAVGSTPSVNGASLSGQALTLQPASSTLPGVLTELSQDIGGVKTFATYVGIGTADSRRALEVLGTGLTAGTSQYGAFIDNTGGTDATSAINGIGARVRSAAGSYTTIWGADFEALQPTIGAGNTLTNYANYYGTNVTSGTSNAFISDNQVFSGNYFINSTSTRASLLSGALTAASFIPSGSTVPTNGMYLPAANSIAFATNSTKVASFGSTGAAVIGSASPNTTQYLTIGNASSSANVAISGVNQTGLVTDFTASSSATTTATGVAAFLRTENASFTTAVAANFRADTISKGASNVITRSIQYQLSGALTVGTNNAGISDNTAFSGDYFINSTSTAQSLLSGPLTVNSVNLTSSTVPANGLYLSAANTLAFAANTTLYGSISSAGLWTIGASGGTTTHVGNGALGVTRNVSAGTATPSTLAMNYVGGNTLSTTNQVAYYGFFNSNSSATASTRGIYIDLSTAASSYTTAFASAFMGGITAGSTSTITRGIIFDASNGFTATGTISNKAYFSDNQAFTGSYMFHISSTLPSNIGGPVVVGSSNGFTGTNYLVRATTSGTSPLTGVSQYGVFSDPVFTSASTTDVASFLAKVQTSAASYTTTIAAAYSALASVKGASNTITRLINYLGVTQTDGTNNAFIADNTAFTGNYFINSTSTAATLISGAVQLGATSSSAAHVFNGTSFTFNTADQSGMFTLNDSGAASSMLFTNASQTGNAKFLIRSQAGGTGNAYITYDTTDDTYSAGILNSDDSWRLCNASDLTSGCKFKLLNNDVSILLGDIIMAAAGGGVVIKEGTNAKMGTCTLSSGACTVSTTRVSANSRIFVSIQSLGTVGAPKAVGVTARTPATSFVITSADATDTSVIAWEIIEPAP